MTDASSRRDTVGRAISALRFPLIIGVVLIHCNLLPSLGTDATGRGHDILGYSVISLLSGIMARSCVPLFFILAGYLYFRGVERFTPSLWWRKTRRRFMSLVVPYLLWNLLGLCGFILKRHLGASAGFSQYEDITLSSLTVLAGFWEMPGSSYPYDFVLWFVRDLISVAVFLSPVVWYIARGGSLVFILTTLAMALWGSGVMYVDGWYYFYAGAFVAVTRIDITWLGRYVWLLSGIWLALALTVLFAPEAAWWNRELVFCCLCCGVMAMTSVAIHYVERGGKADAWLENSAFFVYACHGLYSSAVMRFLLGHISPDSDWAILTVYFLDLILLIGVSLLLNSFCRRFFPTVASLLTGGRS
ncbi:MAG: acyltransferase [Muribaculaceae bacterium]|nr:acyltransferase [Muribaculaceae bacterium]